MSAEDIPTEVYVSDKLTSLLPFASIVSVLIELDRRTGFLDCFTHAGGATPRSPQLKRNLLAVIISQATNLGLARMADASGISYDTLAWAQEWYVREETLRAANQVLITYQRHLPLAAIFGSGTLSSSDGQSFPTQGKSITARALSRYFADQLRLAAPLKCGHVTASLIVGKLSRADRQNALAAALKEYGALRRTIYAARYLSREDYHRKISRQLNKGESIHALRRDVFYAHKGTIRCRHLQHQTEQAWCLTLITTAVITWMTEYLGLAADQLRAQGRRVDDELLAHVSPAHSENIGLFGAITVDIDAELAQLDPTGHRPLRQPPVTATAS